MSQTIPDPRAEALRYMNENKIQILFDYLGSKLARDKPSNPNEYLLQELQYIIEAKSSNQSVGLICSFVTKFLTFLGFPIGSNTKLCEHHSYF